MPTVTGGLSIIDPRGGLVSPPSLPYSKPFLVFDTVASALLLVEAVTSYSSFASSADVKVNGTVVGQIPPLAWNV